MNFDKCTGNFYYWPWDEVHDITADKEILIEQYINMINNECLPLLVPRNIAEYITCSKNYIEYNNCVYPIKGYPTIDIENLNNIHTLKGTNQVLHNLYDMSNNPDKYYNIFSITKRDGSLRTIYAPKRDLKFIQRWIVKHILSSYSVSDNAKAYKKDTSIIDNAKYHLDRSVVVKTDISDFFNSIRLYGKLKERIELPWGQGPFSGYEVIYTRVQSILSVFMGVYPENVALLLANLCCLNGHLPQGAPTSPVISNIIFYPLDKRIEEYCRRNGITYTRYSDDMTFSGDFDPSHLIKTLRFILCESEFKLNEKKTKILRRGQQHKITGIVVNKKIQAPKLYRKRLRQIIYFIKKYGVKNHILYQCNHNDCIALRYVKGNRVYQMRYLQSLLGKVNYVLSINPKDKEFIGYLNKVKSMIIIRKRINKRRKRN